MSSDARANATRTGHAQVLVILSILLLGLAANAASPFMMPQPLPPNGPYFEGWYIRVTDVENHRSFATITSTATEQDISLSVGAELPGYVAFLYNDDAPGSASQGQTSSVEFLPQRTRMVSDETEPGNPHFTWEAAGYGAITDENVALRLPTGEEISVRLGGARVPWNPRWETWGPEGWSAYLPFIPLAWWVDSLGTPSTYKIKLKSGEVITGRGYAHVEKNWGRVFPKAWIWGQATSEDNKAHLAFAGGPLGIGPVEINSYLIGYKKRDKNVDIDIEFRPDQGPAVSYETDFDSCAGVLKLAAGNFRDRIEIVAQAAPESFAPVSIPTTSGFERNRGKESFSTRIEVTIYREGSILEKRVFNGAALEFGAGFMKCAADGSPASVPVAGRDNR